MAFHPELGDIFRAHGEDWRQANASHISLGQLKVMSAIERCRTAELGGHRLHCDHCHEETISYNSCRNRHCPKCQASAARRWLEQRQQELLPVEYFHLVFTLPANIADLAYQNKALMYHLLFQAASQSLLTIARDPKRLGAQIGVIMVLHTWGSALTHHPHVHCVVPGGGIAPEQAHWKPCRPGFFLPVRVLSRIFRRLYLEALNQAYSNGQLAFYGHLQQLEEPCVFERWLKPAREVEWVVYAKPPFAGPAQVLSYLSRYTHRVAISNSRILHFDNQTVTFKWKDYRLDGQLRYQTMQLPVGEFIRRFLLHVLPSGFHRIRHYGFFANGNRKKNLALVRRLLAQPEPNPEPKTEQDDVTPQPFICRRCGCPMRVLEVFQGPLSRAPPGRRYA